MNTWICGDIHANYKGLKQCLERSNFNYSEDTLISLGDVVDGHKNTYEVIEELLKIKNRILIRGNHDEIFENWIDSRINSWNWRQGQLATAKSYMDKLGIENGFVSKSNGEGYIVKLNPGDIPESHKKLFKEQVKYYIDNNNNLFIHGGFNRHYLLSEQQDYIFWWDRDLWSEALSWESMSKGMLDKKPKFKIKQEFNKIFIGHTATTFWEKEVPMQAANIINLDTGAGWYGPLTFWNLETSEYIQSDKAIDLYPDFKGR